MALFFTGCTTTTPMNRKALMNLAQSGRTEAAVIDVGDGKETRLAPGTHLRFKLKDGRFTGWVRASRLAVNDLGVFYRGKVRSRSNPLGSGLLWEQLDGAELKNTSGPKTMALVVGVGVLIATLVALLGEDGVKGFFSASAHVAAAMHPPYVPIVYPPSYYRRARRARRARVEDAPGTAPRIDDADAPLGAPTDDQADASELEDGAWDRPVSESMFLGSALRRSYLEFLFTAQGGFQLNDIDGYTQTLTASLRFIELFELGGGWRYQTNAPTADHIGFGRFGFHFNLDDNHRFAIPLSFDLGAGSKTSFQFKVNAGLRVRVVDGFWIGLYPFNPVFSSLREPLTTTGERPGFWNFPSSLELSFAF